MVAIRPARAEERATVLAIIDAAALATDVDRLDAAIEREDVLVATPEREDRILGALVLEGSEVVNVAVRPRRRGQGIGRALVEAAADRRDGLVATFAADVRPFYESLGFDVEPVVGSDAAGDAADESDRYRGMLE